MKPPVVTITDLGLNTVGYYDWLMTGLGLLAEKSEIALRYRLPVAKAALLHRPIRGAAKALARRWVDKVNGSKWCLEGTVDFGGRTIRFVFDITDHGDLWDVEAFERCDIYFKCQLPTAFPKPLEICRGIHRPMPAEVLAHPEKVRPAMLGRPLSRSRDFRKNLKLLQLWESTAAIPRSKRLFAYFGGDHDPEAVKYAGLPYQHPNVKRARVVRFLRGLDDNRVDARLVDSYDSSLRGPALGDEPFRHAVGASSFNLNISGFSRSIPFRFIDSFLAGTTILTDTPASAWYEPFDEQEVVDLGTMGYELEADVDWPSIEARILAALDTPERELEANRRHVLDRYRRLWSPEALAAYLLRTLGNVL